MASSQANRLIGPDYQEFKLNRQIDSGDVVTLEILESYRDSNNVNYQPRLTDTGVTVHGESPGWDANFIYPTSFKVGIEGTVEPKLQYSPIPQVKFTNTQVDLGAGYNDFVTPGSIFATVDVDKGYQRQVCPDNSMIAGTVTTLDCNLIIGENQRPTIQNSVEVINVESFQPHINEMTLQATDSDNEYVFFSVSDTSTHQGTVIYSPEYTGNLPNKTPTSAEFKFAAVTGVTNDIVTFTVSDGRAGHDKEIQYHFVQAGSGLPDTIDDLSAILSGNNITLNWSQPQSDSGFTDVKINYKINSGSWRETCFSTSSSDTSCTSNVSDGFTYKYRVQIKNTVGWSEWSNIIQVYVPDSTPPTLNNISPSNGQTLTTNDITVSGNAWDVDSGINRVLISLDGQSQIQASGKTSWIWTFVGLSEGNHSLDITAYNGDGLSTSSSTIIFTVLASDVTSPTAAITYTPSGPYKSGDTITITATFSESINTSPIPQISISGSNVVSTTNMARTSDVTYTYSHTISAGDGIATISMSTAQDLAGNIVISTPTSGADFTVDNTVPQIIINGPVNIIIEQNSTYTDAGATATDNLDGDITITNFNNKSSGYIHCRYIHHNL